MTDVNDIKWVTVYEADGEMEALIVKGLLEANEIECVMDENASPYVIMGIPAHVTVHIKVKEEDTLVARALIEEPAPVVYE